MALERQIVTWPLTGGLASKDSPLSQVPGTHLILKNIRQERSDEWRPRFGYSQAAIDTLPTNAAPARQVETPGGGAIALSAESGFLPAGLSYVPAGASGRWNRCQAADCSQTTPSVWSRRTVMTADAIVRADYCEGSVYSLTARGAPAGNGVAVALASKADGTQISDPNYPAGVVNTAGILPRCITGPSDRLCLVYIDATAASLIINTWNGATGANLGANTILAPASTHAFHLLDAWWYGGTTITIAVRIAAGTVRFMEYDPVAAAIGTNVVLGAADTAISLLPDPDLSGTRFLATSDTVNNTRVQRVSSAGAVLTTDTVFAGTTPAITGVGYAAGVSWMVVYENTTGGLAAVKKRAGVVSAVTTLIPAPLSYRLDSVAWREIGTDVMRYIAGIHTPLTNAADPQQTYLELALPFDTGATVVNLFPEAQARLLPLIAGYPMASPYDSALSHTQRTGSGQFVLALPRLARFGRQPAAVANQYAVDRWTTTQVPAGGLTALVSGGPANLGPGIATGDAAYLPSGLLLTSADGRRIVSHGLSVVPSQPTISPGGAGGLTIGQLYQWLVVVEVPDENGRTWRSPPSVAASATPGVGAQNVAVVISAPELQSRIVTVKIYRTKGNGFVFQLVNQRTGTVLALQSFTFNDTVTDAALSSTDFLAGEAPATITPAFSHVAFWGGRMFGVDRDFPTRLWCSKVIRAAFQPEFPGDVGFITTFDDEFGDITGIVPLDDKLVITKRRARYALQGDGPDPTGGGQPFAVSRVGSDWGCLPGGTLVSTGVEIFSTTERGVWLMDTGLRAEYVGAGIDQWLNQESLGVSGDIPQQTIVGGFYHAKANEVRLLTGNTTSGQPKQFVYDRLRSIWYVDDGDGILPSLATRMIGSRQVLFTNSGRMLFEATNQGVMADDSIAFTSGITSAWFRPAGNEGRLRLYKARVLGSQLTGAPASSPFMVIFFDNGGPGTFELFYPLAPFVGTNTIVRAEAAPRRQQCSSFSLALVMGSTSPLRLDKWAAEIGLKPGMQKLPSSQRWRSP